MLWIMLQTGGNWITDPGSYSAFALIAAAAFLLYQGNVVSKKRVEEIQAECDKTFNLMKEERDYWRAIGTRVIEINEKSIETTKLVVEK